MRLKSNNGFTLVELLIAVYVLLIGICGTFLLYINCMNSGQYAWDSTVAVTHAQYILEEMQNTTSLQGIVTTDWNDWAQKQKLTSLPDETIKVIYLDPDSNPLNLQVEVDWQRKNSTQNVALSTILMR